MNDSSTTRSLVIGATGMVGGHILRQLVLRGEKPLALSRSSHDSEDTDWIRGDLATLIASALPEFGILYSTADVGQLADALPRMSGPALSRVVAFTSTSILTKANSESASERERIAEWMQNEQRLIAVCEGLGVACTILRPTLIYDEGKDRNVSRLAGLIRRLGFIPMYGRGTGLRQPVHAEDLAIGAIDAAHSTAAKNKIYELPGGETIPYHEMVGRIFDGMKRPRRAVPLPPFAWRLGFGVARWFLPNTDVAMGTRMAKDMIFDPTPAINDFGWRPRGFHPSF
jgi:nucleoside-diphosphate-sugar epimerase